MTITDNSSPPLSPLDPKLDTGDSSPTSQPLLPVELPVESDSENIRTRDKGRRPSLPSSAINKTLFYHFPTPPQSPRSPPRIAPIRPPRRQSLTATPNAIPTKHTRTSSTKVHSPSASSPTTQHARRRSSVTAISPNTSSPITAGRRYSKSTMEYGPPPHPAPTAPLPKTPLPPYAPRIPFTTPQQERNRHSSCELYYKLLPLQKQQEAMERSRKRLSAPVMGSHKSEPVFKSEQSEVRGFRRVKSNMMV